MEKRFPFLIGLIIILVLIGSQSIFIVNQTEKALVIQLGDPVDKVFGPGLHFKIPLIQTVVRFDARVLDYEARAAEALTSDKKAIVLDNYARWRISIPCSSTDRCARSREPRPVLMTWCTPSCAPRLSAQPDRGRLEQTQRHHGRRDPPRFGHHERVWY